MNMQSASYFPGRNGLARLGLVAFFAGFFFGPEKLQAEVFAECGQEFVPQVQRESLVWKLKWEFFDSIVFGRGSYSVSATGPVPVQPLDGTFDALNSLNNEFFSFINETYPTVGIWTIDGEGFLYRFIGGPQVIQVQEDGLQSCNATGIF